MTEKQVYIKGQKTRLTNRVFSDMRPGLRLATLADVGALSALEGAAFNDRIYERMTARTMRHIIKDGNGAMIGAWEGQSLRGCAVVLFKCNSRKANFASLSVAPEAQGQGIGSVLFAAAERLARAAGADTMILEIRADNRRLKKNYLEKGYRIVHEVANYYPDGCPCLKFSGALNG